MDFRLIVIKSHDPASPSKRSYGKVEFIVSGIHTHDGKVDKIIQKIQKKENIEERGDLEVVQAPVRPLRPRFQFQRPAQEPEETFLSFISTVHMSLSLFCGHRDLSRWEIFLVGDNKNEMCWC